MALFERDPLRDGTGELKERWGQSGSHIVNIDEGVSADENLYTVTSGKTLYVTDVIFALVSGSNDADEYAYLRDGTGVSDTVKLSINAQAYTGGEILNFHFSTPIVFTEAVYYREGSPSTDIVGNFTISGWEE